ncbi:MAG: carbon-nitrogen hydrolase family protein [Deltaproteobacteria bacterium]|jgi:predicted amidohydrolase
MRYVAAVCQLTTTEDVEASLASAERLVREAAAAGARFVTLPENVSFMGPERAKLPLAEPVDGPTFSRLAKCADDNDVFLLAGTLPEVGPSAERAYNTSVLFGPDGRRLAVYRKIHLFDVALGEGATHLESRTVEPGARPVLASTPIGKIGLTVCYDLRFPDLYRSYFRAGAELLTVPSAFTVPTGRDHWEVLLRARAIENQAYVFAPAQVGQNAAKRNTYGRSMIVDPWGTVVAQCVDEVSFALATIDLERVHSLRTKLPCRDHERLAAYTLSE